MNDDAQVELWNRQALEALQGAYSIDELVGFELATQADGGTLEVTPLGYSIAADVGWKVEQP